MTPAILGVILQLLAGYGIDCKVNVCTVTANYNQDFFYVTVCNALAQPWSFGAVRHRKVLDNGYVIDYPETADRCVGA